MIPLQSEEQIYRIEEMPRSLVAPLRGAGGLLVSLLKSVPVRLYLDAFSMSRVLQFTVTLDADVVSFGAQHVSCGLLVASVAAP